MDCVASFYVNPFFSRTIYTGNVMASTPSQPSGEAAGAAGASTFIGALISLVSRSDIRYQGFLASIDSAQATIALEKGE